MTINHLSIWTKAVTSVSIRPCPIITTSIHFGSKTVMLYTYTMYGVTSIEHEIGRASGCAGTSELPHMMGKTARMHNLSPFFKSKY